MHRILRIVTSSLCLLVCSVYAVNAAEKPQTNPMPTIPGWDEFVDGVRDLPNQVFAKLPASMQNDPQTQQEIARLLVATLASATLDAVSGDGDYPAFLPLLGQTLNATHPNPDTVYRATRIAPGGTYRLRGKRGSLRIATIGQAVGPPPNAMKAYNDINALHVDAQDNFDVLLSPTRPSGYASDWWELLPSTKNLLLRMVSADWTKERDATISIERVDKPMGRPRRSANDLEQRLRNLPEATAALALPFVDDVTRLRRGGHINKFNMTDTALVTEHGGVVGQLYFMTAYEIRDDEALILEAKMPTKCQYSSAILANEIDETLDASNNQTSLNDAQAKPDRDGVLRMVVAGKDPGVPNWLDTAGNPKGLIEQRWTNCSEKPVPKIRKVALSDVRKSLPNDTKIVTPEQRDQELRTRHFHFQQRPIW